MRIYAGFKITITHNENKGAELVFYIRLFIFVRKGYKNNNLPFCFKRDRAEKPPAPEPPVVVIHPTMPDACIVTWSPPCDDITLYIVERCDLVGDVWIVVSQQKEAQFVAQNLVPGIEYSFRVSAENEVGMGKWSKPSEPIVIIRKGDFLLHPFSAYCLGEIFRVIKEWTLARR